MDVEKTIQFLLEEGARLDARQARNELEIEKTQRQLRAAVRLGGELSRRAFRSLDALATAQRETDARMQEHKRENDAQIKATMARIDTMLQLWERRWNGNGHGTQA